MNQDAAPAEQPKRRFDDFSDLVGTWTEDPAFDEIMGSMRQIDPEDWEDPNPTPRSS